MNASRAQKTDLSDVLASFTARGITKKTKKHEPSFEEKMKALARTTKYLLENDQSYRRAYKNHPSLLRQQKKWIAEQLQ